jgi:hypothetical protein
MIVNTPNKISEYYSIHLTQNHACSTLFQLCSSKKSNEFEGDDKKSKMKVNISTKIFDHQHHRSNQKVENIDKL